MVVELIHTHTKEQDMTSEQIEQRMEQQRFVGEVALAMRRLLDNAREDYPGSWDEDEVAETLADLVFEE